MTPTPLNPQRLERFIRQLTLVVTNIVKLAGVFIAVRAVSHEPVDPVVLIVSAFMMSGAQASEKAAMRLMAGFMGRTEEQKHEEHGEHK